MIKKLFILIIIIAVVGGLLSYSNVDNGLAAYRGEEELFAAYALQQTRAHFSSLTDRLTVHALHVSSIQQAKSSTFGCERIELGPHMVGVHHAYTATVAAYTFFGKSYRTVTVACDGSVH